MIDPGCPDKCPQRKVPGQLRQRRRFQHYKQYTHFLPHCSNLCRTDLQGKTTHKWLHMFRQHNSLWHIRSSYPGHHSQEGLRGEVGQQ